LAGCDAVQAAALAYPLDALRAADLREEGGEGVATDHFVALGQEEREPLSIMHRPAVRRPRSQHFDCNLLETLSLDLTVETLQSQLRPKIHQLFYFPEQSLLRGQVDLKLFQELAMDLSTTRQIGHAIDQSAPLSTENSVAELDEVGDSFEHASTVERHADVLITWLTARRDRLDRRIADHVEPG
jgi:hypothetical protein